MKSSSSARTRRHPSGGSGGRVVFGCLHLSSITFAAALCIMITLLRLHSLGRFAAPPMSSRATSSIAEGLANTEGRTPSVWDEVRRSASFDSNDTVLPHAPYRPTWKRWRMHMFHALDDDLLAEGSCVGWRQTMLCSPDGPIEPHFSRPCKTVVTSGSGYCLCKHGRRVNQVGCGAVHFTCAEACSGIPSSRKSESDASGSSGGNQEQPALMLRQGKMLEEIEARGRDIKRRLLAQRSLLAVIYPPIVQEQHPKNENESAEDVAVKRSKANNTSGNDTNVPPPKKTHAPPQQQDVVDHVVEAEVARRKREAAWKATMKEYDRWTKQWYDAKVQQSARDLGDSVCVGWRSSSDCNPNGRRQPELDRGCGAVIRANSHNGGYCECNREAGIAPVFIGCRHRAFTCKQVCSPLFKLETLELSRGEELQAPEAELVKLNAETNSETAIRSQVEHERQSSREFGLAHLRAVDAARQLRERSTLHEAKYETNEPSQQRERLLGAAIANAFGKHRTPAQVQTIGAENAQGEEIPYRLPDALIDKEKEDQYYRYLDRIQSEHEKKKRAEVIAEDDKDRL